MSFQFVLISASAELPEEGGFVLKVCLQKPRDFIPRQIRLRVIGDEFWRVLGKVMGSSIVTTFRHALHPMILSPDVINIPNSFSTNSTESHLTFHFLSKKKEEIICQTIPMDNRWRRSIVHLGI